MRKITTELIKSNLFGDYLHEFTSGYARVFSREKTRIKSFEERYGDNEEEILRVCQNGGEYVTEQMFRVVQVLRQRFNDAIKIPQYEQRIVATKELTCEAINLLYTGEDKERKKKDYPKYSKAYANFLATLERIASKN